ncbi:MAG: S1C family serine protease [Parcubacteria group bacterium]
MLKKISIILAIILVAGLSGILADHFLFPYLTTTDLFQRYKWLEKSAENITVINKTEQVYVKEDSSVARLMSPVVSSVVNVISYPDSDVKNVPAADKYKNGTGIIATSDGMIMTYASAIDYGKSSEKAGSSLAYKYKVMTADGNLYDADFVGIDSWSNLAFLKISASNLPVISFGDFGNYKAGEKVIAIGNDRAVYQNDFNTGILNSFDPTFNISGQALSVPEKMEGVFLSNFDPEYLSAGSPIVDYSGQVVGIVGSVQKQDRLEYFEIPTDKIKTVLNKVIQNRLDSNPIFGAYYIPVTKTLAATQKLGVENGALIYSASGQQGLAIIAASPAAKAGLKIGDIITKVNDTDINLDNNLSSVLYTFKKGDKIHLTLMRAGLKTELDVQL